MRPLPVNLDDLVAMVGRRGHDAITRLTLSVEMANELSGMSDQLVGHFVDEARANGASWADIGGCLGVSRQAAQKRFVFTGRPTGPKRDRIFGRFSAPTRALVHEAVDIARTSGSDHIGTEHFLLAILRHEDDIAAAAITTLGSWGGDRVRSTIEESLRSARGRRGGHKPFAAEAKKMLQLALRETLRSGERQIGSKHVLLAMLRDQQSAAATLLREEELTLKKVEDWFASAA